jgi:hypothetical protein
MGLFKDCGCGCNGTKQKKKFITSAVSALIFFIVANPETFKITRKVLGSWVASGDGSSTVLGLVFHAFVFMLIVWGLMNLKRENADGTMTPPPMTMNPMGETMPPPIPEGAATPDGLLPPVAYGDQPQADITSSAPTNMIMPSIMTSPKPSSMGNMGAMNSMLGGIDINGADMASSPLTSGTNWKQCGCSDGSQVMILK